MTVRDKMYALAKWCNGETELDELGVHVMTVDGAKLAKPTQWIVEIPGTKYYKIVDDIEMLKSYVRVA